MGRAVWLHESIHLSKELDLGPIHELIKLSPDCVGYGKLIQERNREVSRSGRLHMYNGFPIHWYLMCCLDGDLVKSRLWLICEQIVINVEILLYGRNYAQSCSEQK